MHTTVNRPNMVQVGTIVWLSSELMFFAGLFAMYFTIRAVLPRAVETEPAEAEHPLLGGRTRSTSCSPRSGARWASSRPSGSSPSALGAWWTPWTREHGWRNWGMREWYTLTYIAGALFVAGQVFEYANLVQEGLTIVLERLRLGLLPDHRFPRPARHRRSDRLPAHHRPQLRRQALRPRARRPARSSRRTTGTSSTSSGSACSSSSTSSSSRRRPTSPAAPATVPSPPAPSPRRPGDDS